MSKRMFHLLLAVLMVVAVVLGPMTGTVEAAVEQKELEATLIEFTWQQKISGYKPIDRTEYALVGNGNGEAVFEKLVPQKSYYGRRFGALVNVLKDQAKEVNRLEGISFVQIKDEPKELTYKAGTNVRFNGQDIAKIEGDSVFVIASWSMADYEAKPEEGDATLYLYHPDGCMDGKGEKRELCNGCGLITVHEMLQFCGHSSCVDGTHAKAKCGVEGHKACYDRHGAARCGLKGHYVCTGVHTAAACKTAGHFVCDGKTHTACPGCGVLQCSKNYKAAEHKAACGHYACASGYKADDHKKLDCGHYACTTGNHTKDACGHYKCSSGYKADDHKIAACGAYACAHAGPHTLGDCGAHYTCVKPGSHKIAACGAYACAHAGPHNACTVCGAFLCQGSHAACSE